MTNTQRKRARSANQPTGQWIRRERRLAIYCRDSFRCVYCCRDLHHAGPQDVTLDHLVSKSDGGSNDSTNLVTACRACNCSRQDKPLSRFASRECRADIRHLTARSMGRYMTLARALIAGTTGDRRS